jgi:hypothetical protein
MEMGVEIDPVPVGLDGGDIGICRISAAKKKVEEVSLEGDQPGVFLELFFCLYAVLQLGVAPGNILAFIKQAMNF